jgi:hypothetical protein
MTMANTQPPDRSNADLQKCIAFGVALIWLLSLLVLASAFQTSPASLTGDWVGRAVGALLAFLTLAVTTVTLLVLGLLALVNRYHPGRRPSARQPEPDITEHRIDWIRHAVIGTQAPHATRHAATASQTPDQTKPDAPLFPGLIKGTAIAAGLTCVLSGLAWLTASQPSEGSAALALLILSTPVFVVFGGCELIARHLRRRSVS